MSLTTQVILEADMLAQAKARILTSQDWITAIEIAKLARFNESDASSLLNRWMSAGRIFAINHKGMDYFPLFGLELSPVCPRLVVKQIIETMALDDPWQIAFWFDAANSHLDGRRPQDVIASDPEKVLVAASEEGNWTANG